MHFIDFILTVGHFSFLSWIVKKLARKLKAGRILNPNARGIVVKKFGTAPQLKQVLFVCLLKVVIFVLVLRMLNSVGAFSRLHVFAATSDWVIGL